MVRALPASQIAPLFRTRVLPTVRLTPWLWSWTNNSYLSKAPIMDATQVLSLSQNRGRDAPLDLKLWMTHLPQHVRNTPLIRLAIPGSHDSMTYAMRFASRVSPDAEPVLQRLRFLGPLLTTFMSRWCKTQDINVREQLACGIRYFDLRIATKKKNDKFYFVHGLYCHEVFGELAEVKSFLKARPNEVVILDCQHFYAFQQSDHERFMSQLTTFFGDKALPYKPKIDDVSLHSMSEKKHQVILFYRSDAAAEGQPNLWPSYHLPTPWADTVSVPELIPFLVAGIKSRNVNLGFVSQCVLTPTMRFVTTRFYSSLKSSCFLPLEESKYKWLSEQRQGLRGVNVVISDFVGHKNGAFAKAVINLNRKLLEKKMSDHMTPIDGGR